MKRNYSTNTLFSRILHRSFLLVCLLFFISAANAQECECTNCPVTLPDVLTTTFNGYLNVSGAVNNTLGGNNCIESVCVEISHDFIGDIDITLTAPDGTSVVLFADGNTADNCPCGNPGESMNVCFTLPGQSTNGSFAAAGAASCTNASYYVPCNGVVPCYSGTWEPWGQVCGAGGLEVFNNGSGTVNGVWTISINDNALFNFGVLENFEIQFCEDDGITCESVGCLAQAGTVTSTYTGSSLIPEIICDGGSVNFTSNGDYILPAAGCGTCVPELIYAIYYAGGPTGPDPESDPNFTTWYWTGEDFTTAGSGGFNQNSGGASSLLSQLAPNATNTWCFVPVTADAGDLPNVDNDGDGCFDLGTPLCFQFLNPISAQVLSSCDNVVELEIIGGYPEFHGGNYAITNTGSGTLSSSTLSVGSPLLISGLNDGDTYSISINGGGCVASISGIYSTSVTVTVSPSTTTVNAGECVDLTGTITYDSGSNSYFENLTDYDIPDWGIGGGNNNPTITTGDWINSPISVSSICPNIFDANTELRVCMDIYHDFNPDLNIWLQSPNGQFLLLDRDNTNGIGFDYSQTCFTTNAITAITSGTSPFTGDFIPIQPFSNIYGTPMNGVWNLWIADDGIFDTGYLMNWSIEITPTPAGSFTWTPTTALSNSSILNPQACPTSNTTYVLTADNGCGCTATASSSVSINSAPPVNVVIASSVDVLCYGENSGSAIASASSGLAPYSYSWNTTPAQNGATATGLTAGTYTVTVTDANSSVSTANVTITEPASPLIVYAHGTDPSCSNLCDGDATVDVVGGTGPYTYAWSNGASTQSISALCANTYSVVVTDANGCASNAFVPTDNCFQIQAILVNSCSGTEWNEEMVFFQTGPNPLSTSSLTVTWPTVADTWQNLCSNPGYIAAVNATITNGGQVLPMPVSGILPANANVVLVTEDLLSSPIADFSNLSGTLYMIFQCSGNTQGHFVNSGTSANPLVLNFGGGCTQTVSYVPNSLPNYNSSSNGGYVLYSDAGTPSYLNYGCAIPYTIQSNEVVLDGPAPIDPNFDALTDACQGSSPITLPITSTDFPGITGTWSPSVSTTNSGLQTYTFTPSAGQCANSTTLTQFIVALPTASISGSTSICAGSSTSISLSGTPNAEVSYTVNGGSVQTSILDGSGNASLNTGTLSSTATYALTGVSITSGITCSQALNSTAIVSVTASPSASIIYPGSPYCKNLTVPQAPSISGTSGGSFSSAPAGLSINASTGAIVPSTSAAGTYTITYSIPAAGACPAFSATTSIVINNIPPIPSLLPDPICAGSATTITAGNGSWYEFFINGVSQEFPSATSTLNWTMPASGDQICVHSYPPLPFTFDGNIIETEWSNPLSTSAGGASSAFGANYLDALYLQNSGGYLYSAIAGQTENNSNNRILLFIDCASGGYNNLGAWSPRTNAPYVSVENLNGLITFDPGFNPDFIVCMNQASGIAYFDLYDMQNDINYYLGSDITAGLISNNLLGYQANGGPTNYSQGFEFAIPMSLLGNPTGTLQTFCMLVNDPGIGNPAATFVSNQFLTPANAGESNYADGFIDFGAAAPDPISFSLSADCYSQNCITVSPSVTPNTVFTYTPTVCEEDPDVSPTLASGFTLGGSFSSSSGLVINSSTGQIDVSASTPGDYTINYSVPAIGCNPAASGTFDITIYPTPSTTPIYHE